VHVVRVRAGQSYGHAPHPNTGRALSA
jgi:hypothetical protein